MSFLLLYIIASWSPLIAASGTSPSEPSFVPDPSGRGTVGLLWTCILTLWPCVWTAIHLNVPRRDSKWWQRFLNKFSFAAMTLVFPELMLTVVVSQFFCAWRFAKEMNKVIASRNEDGQSTQLEPHQGCPAAAITSDTRFENWNLTTAFFGMMGGFEVKFGRVESDSEGRRDVLTPKLLIGLARGNMLAPVDNWVCKDRGKSDEIGKLFVVGQVTWFILQCIGRKATGLPVTLLEINTSIHVACAIGIYGLMWFKPQGANEALVMDVSKCPKCDQFIKENVVDLVSRADNLSAEMHDEFDQTQLRMFTIIILGLIYGGLHTVAWDAHFPSYAEQILWRVSALLIVGSSAVLYFFYRYGLQGEILIVMVLSFAPRLYLVIEAFISVRSLPVGAYQTVDWVEFLPHIG